jgi:four helix bundle protein
MDRPHKSLDAWKKAVDLTVTTYRLTEKIPKDEDSDLVAQMRRIAISVPANIAEGAGKTSKKEFVQFLMNARASLSKLDSQAATCRKLGYLSDQDHALLRQEMRQQRGLITSLISHLKRT